MNDMDRLRPLLQKLGEAINETLNDSISIGDAVEEIKDAGFDVFLVLEGTIGFHKREDVEKPQELREPRPLVQGDEIVPGTFNSWDGKLLRQMKIRLD